MNNIIGTHIDKTEKRFKKYCSLILKTKYDKSIVEEFVQTYIDARYYNYGVDKNIKFFYRRIYDALVKKSKKLIKAKPNDKLKIENTLILFQYFFYFDNVRENVKLEEIVQLIAEKRIARFKLRLSESDDFIEEFSNLVMSDKKETDSLLELYNTNDFDIHLKRLETDKNNFYFVKMSYNFDFPKIFSKEAIEEVFNTDIIAEDRLFVEYPLVANLALRDILDGNFNKKYIVDFSPELLKKTKKLEQLLEVIDDEASQDKIYLTLDYNSFIENKTVVYKLIKRGFKFVLQTNEQMPKLNNDELKILEVFDWIIPDEKDANRKKYKRKKLLVN